MQGLQCIPNFLEKRSTFQQKWGESRFIIFFSFRYGDIIAIKNCNKTKRLLATCLEVGADEPIEFSILNFWKCSWRRRKTSENISFCNAFKNEGQFEELFKWKPEWNITCSIRRIFWHIKPFRFEVVQKIYSSCTFLLEFLCSRWAKYPKGTQDTQTWTFLFSWTMTRRNSENGIALKLTVGNGLAQRAVTTDKCWSLI